jgi:hypothetical protein
MRNFDSPIVFRETKELLVRLSAWPAKIKGWTPEEGHVDRLGEDLEPHLQGCTHQISILRDIGPLSRLMPALESIDLHWFNALGYRYKSPSHPTTPQEIEGDSPSMNLRECRIRGIYTSEADLLHFLKSTRASSVTLADVHLVSGSYVSMMDYFADPDSPVTSYHLDDIRGPRVNPWERNVLQLVHFEVPGRAKFPISQDRPGPSTIDRRGSQVKDVVRYRYARGRALGSGQIMRWNRAKSLELGSRSSPDFIHPNWPGWDPQITESEDGSNYEDDGSDGAASE